MATKLVKSAGLLLCLTANLWAADPWLGTWKINVAKSEFGPLVPPPKSVTITVEMVGDQIRSTAESVASNGTTLKTVWIGKFDGKPYPFSVASSPGLVAAIKRVGARVLEQTNSVNGKLVSTSRYTFSKNGKTVNLVAEGVNAKGEKFHLVQVGEKQ